MDTTHTNKKILFVITQGSWGGAQRYVFDLASNLKNMSVTVAIGEPGSSHDLQDLLSRAGIQVIQLRHLQRAIQPLHDLLAIRELYQLYGKIKPDIIHLNSSKAGVVGSLATKRYGYDPRVIYTVHGWVFLEPIAKWKKMVYRWLEMYTAAYKNHIIYLSDQDKATGKSIGIEEQTCSVIPLGLSQISIQKHNKSRDGLRHELGIQNKTHFVVGTIANCYRTKGLDIFIKAAAHIAQEKSEIQYIIIGDGPERRSLEALTKEHHVEKFVKFTGFLPHASAYLPAFDLFVLSSKKEGMPYTLLEAATAGTPIIASNVGGVSGLVENKKTGLLVPPNDPTTLAEAILWARANQTKMTMYALCAQKETEKHRTLDVMVLRTKTLYREELHRL